MNTIRIRLQKHAPVSYQEIALGMLASALCAAGLAALLIPAFPHIHDSWILYAVCAAVISASFCMLMFLQTGKWIELLVSALVLILFLIRFPSSRNGILTLANDFLTFLTGRTGRIHTLFQTDGSAGTFLIPVLYLLLLSLVTASAFRKKCLAFPVILLAISAAAVIFRFPSSPSAAPLFALDTAVSLAACRRADSALRGFRAGFLTLLLPVGITAALSAAVLLPAAALSDPGETPFRADAAAGRIRHALHVLCFESEGGTGMPEGDLRRAGLPSEDDVPMLRLTMSHPEKLYLRGFTGETYENSVWSGPDDAACIDHAELFRALHAEEFYGQHMIAAAAEALDTVSPDAQQTTVITPVHACRKYRYLPYALTDTALLDPSLIGDAGSPAAPLHRYDSTPFSVTSLSGGLPDWYETALSLSENTDNPAAAEYLRLEQAYCSYVTETDRRLSEEAAAFCAALFGTEKTERSLSDILTLVQQTLDENFTYIKEPADMDHMESSELLSLRHSDDALAAFASAGYGTSAHFASAATLMLRYLGVPARYVEGYFLTADEAAGYSPGEEIVLTSAHAHAWSEFYIRGIGWVPFETVPGLRDSEELSKLMSLSESSRTTASGSPMYVQTEILYTSGIYDDIPEAPQKNIFTWRKEYFLILLAFVISFFAALILFAFFSGKRRYRKAMDTIRSAKEAGDCAKAVSLEFSYASMLMETADLEDPPGLEKTKLLNEKARFSTQKITDDQLAEAETFTQQVILACRSKWSLKERIYYHWIRRII